MNSLALTEAPDHVCSRYRIRAFEPALRRAGVSLQVTALARAPIPRAIQLAGLNRTDLVLLQRKLLPPWQLKLIRRKARHFVFDFDDAVLYRDSYDARGPHCPRRARRFKATVRLADTVIAGNDFLADCALRAGARAESVRVIPTCVETDHYRLAEGPRPKTGLDLAWIGSSSTLRGVEAEKPLWEKVAASVPNVRLRLIADRGGGPRRDAGRGGLLAARDGGGELAAGDVGVALMPDDLWSRGKCGLKILQYQAAGLPVLANPVGVHHEMVEPGVSAGCLGAPTSGSTPSGRSPTTSCSVTRWVGRAARRWSRAIPSRRGSRPSRRRCWAFRRCPLQACGPRRNWAGDLGQAAVSLSRGGTGRSGWSIAGMRRTDEPALRQDHRPAPGRATLRAARVAMGADRRRRLVGQDRLARRPPRLRRPPPRRVAADGRLRVVKTGPHRVVYRSTSPRARSSSSTFSSPASGSMIRQWLRRGKGRNEGRRTKYLDAIGVPTITPIALGEQRKRKFLLENYLITPEITGSVPLNEFVERRLPELPEPRRTRVRQALSKALAIMTARLHHAGFVHQDFHPGNILVRLSPDDRPVLAMIDLDALRLCRNLTWSVAQRNLALLNHYFWLRSDRTDRQRFFVNYLRARRRFPPDLKAFAQGIETATRSWAEKLWRRWGKRCARTNKYFKSV